MPHDAQRADLNSANPEHRGDDNPPASVEAGQAGASAPDASVTDDPSQADTASSGTVAPASQE